MILIDSKQAVLDSFRNLQFDVPEGEKERYGSVRRRKY